VDKGTFKFYLCEPEEVVGASASQKRSSEPLRARRGRLSLCEPEEFVRTKI
jgi:hypothetical protein